MAFKEDSKKGLGMRFLLCFSAYTNGQKLMSTRRNPKNIDCINGIRTMAMSWVVLGHTYFFASQIVPWENKFTLEDVISNNL